MNWIRSTSADLTLHGILFKSQHIKYTPEDYVKEINIENFDQYLTNVWSETVQMINKNQLEHYNLLDADGNLQGFIIGSKDSDTFNIRHFNATDIENIPQSVFREFIKMVGTKSITMRTRRGIQKYHELINGWNFKHKEYQQGYDIYILHL